MSTLHALFSIDLLIMAACYLVERRTRRAGIVDAGWSLAIMLSSLFVAWRHTAGDPATRLFVALACGAWFARLGIHLLRRYLHETREDGRYAHMRQASGRHEAVVFALFFLFQAGLALLFSLPMWALTRVPAAAWNAGHPLWLALSAALMLIAWAGEWTADRQLARFRRQPGNRGRTLRSGLWAWSRHPNYFFEWLHWLAYPMAGLGIETSAGPAAGLPLLWLYPVLMFLFLYYLTGIPFTEQQALRSRGDDYRRYQQDTPIFFPRRPRS